MIWARTLRLDAAPTAAASRERVAALERDGVRVRLGEQSRGDARTYVLVEGPAGVDPAQLESRVPGARWYDAPIIALAIEPLCPDALQALARALGGPGSPAGVCGCSAAGGELVVEFRPDVTPPDLILRSIDVELRPFGGGRRTRLLTPLPMSLAAAIAAAGLGAPEIAPDRVLEALLEAEHVE